MSVWAFIGLKIGMGDLKLWLALLARAVVIAGLLVVANYLRIGRKSTSIAFAPVLLLPFLSLYLGI
jgi:hypothetical protein